jgi:chromosome segregation ATPase
MSDSEDKRDTKPPGLVPYEPEPDLSSFPPSVVTSVAQRIEVLVQMAREDRVDNRSSFELLSQGQIRLADSHAKLMLIVETHHVGVATAIDKMQGQLLRISSDQRLLAVEIRSIRQEQLAQHEQIVALQEIIATLRRDDEALRAQLEKLGKRFDVLSTRLDADTAARNGGPDSAGSG